MGDDVTINAHTIGSIPLALRSKDVPAILEVRGEVYMDNEDFRRVNKRSKPRAKKYANRASHLRTLRRLDPKIVAKRACALSRMGSGGSTDGRQGYWEWTQLLHK